MYSGGKEFVLRQENRRLEGNFSDLLQSLIKFQDSELK